MSTGQAQPPLLTPAEVAARLGVPVSWVYSNAEAGRLPSLKIGKYRRFENAVIAQWLDQHRQGRAELTIPKRA